MEAIAEGPTGLFSTSGCGKETRGGPAGSHQSLPLLVGHGILFRVFLLDVVLGGELGDALDERFASRAMERIWQMGSHNCGLSVFARGESRYPGGLPIPGWTCLTWMERPWDRP